MSVDDALASPQELPPVMISYALTYMPVSRVILKARAVATMNEQDEQPTCSEMDFAGVFASVAADLLCGVNRRSLQPLERRVEAFLFKA